MSKWISVKDEMPKQKGRYLVNGTYKISIKSFYKGSFYSHKNVLNYMSEKEMDEWFNGAQKFTGVTHWMELSSPYEAKK